MSNADALLKRLTSAERATQHANVRPKDAATLLILDQAAGGPVRVLMGRRHTRHAFFPGAYVFPGGRVDPSDSRVPVAVDYHPAVARRLAIAMKGPKSASRARAFGVAAIRETYEEAGLFLGTRATSPKALTGEMAAFADHGVALDLSPLVLIARAITPPRRPRRFDTRFFACFADTIAATTATGLGPSGELEDVAWLTFDEAKRTEIPTITQTILETLDARLSHDGRLDPEAPGPFYQWRGKGFVEMPV